MIMPAENTKFSSISRAICYFVPRKSYRGRTRFHRWNDFDRLTLSLGHDFCGYYGYDADGIRTYKLTGTCKMDDVNGGDIGAQAIFDDMVLYPSPFVVVTPRGYTNHYYAGSERIASRIGNLCWLHDPFVSYEKPSPEWTALEEFQNLPNENYPFGRTDDWSDVVKNSTPIQDFLEKVQYPCPPVDLKQLNVLYSEDMLHDVMACKTPTTNIVPVYYYHPDHLGSTSWVTDEVGNDFHILAYMPYGEPFMDKHPAPYDTRYGQDFARYQFTGKERDAETGYDYIEQRYYWWPGGFWLRPDPLLDKYINLSPYAYCDGNPMKYVDLNGELFETAWDIANVIMDGRSLIANLKDGNYLDAAIDGGCLLLDGTAALFPCIPGGAGTIVKASRTTKLIENTQRGVKSEQRVLKDMGLIKNTKKIGTVTDSKEAINVIPDAIQDGVMYEVKDTKVVNRSKQIQGEINAASEAGLDYKIVTGENTHVSSKIPEENVIRRNDLGPQN
jgi:RHS repeat-associated protein